MPMDQAIGSEQAMRRQRGVSSLLFIAIFAWRFALTCGAQPMPPTQPAGEGIALNFPDNAPLKAVIDYVSARLGFNVIYDEQAVTQRVTLRTPVGVPREALMGVLETVLRSKGLAIIDAEQAGWKKVVPVAGAARPATQPGIARDGQSAVATQVFQLTSAEPARVSAAIKPFLSTPGGSAVELAEQRILIVTEYASNLDRLAELVRLVDQPRRQVDVAFIPVVNADAAAVRDQLEQILAAKLKAQGIAAADGVSTAFDPRTSQIVVIGPPQRIEDARQVLRSLDAPVSSEQSPVRFYKLANATAAEVLATIKALEEEQQQAAGAGDPSGASSSSPAIPSSSSGPADPPASTATPARPRVPSPENTSGSLRTSPTASTPLSAPASDGGNENITPGRSLPSAPAASPNTTRDSIRTRNARITADPNTNSIIVVAEPSIQRLYENLIKQLDKRRPQVMIEATIVTLDTSNDFELGVEIAGSFGSDDNKVITFSSFGLSTVDPKTGGLAITPGMGFNGTLISTNIADIVVRALASNRRARVMSAPRILVNDNSTGTLASIAEFPFTSINASDTVSTTSFGGYAEAGTAVTVTPHISEADYLQLEYTVSLNTFTGTGDARRGIPPPRKTDSVTSKVTIPDGSTIVVGGLNRNEDSLEKDAIPILGDIPVLEYFFSNRVKSASRTTLFVFIRPTILRDDQFEDLKFMSERDVKGAGIPDDFPGSEPVVIR